MTTQRVISRTETTSSDLDTDYKWGFTIDIDSDVAPKGLSEDVVRLISAKKGEPEWMLEWRLKAYRHWLRLNYEEPAWANIEHPKIDFQDIYYYAAPSSGKDAPKSLDEVDPEILEAFDKLGIPLAERERLAGVAVDAVLDSVSVATTYQETLEKAGIIFCSMSEAIRNHPDLVQKYLGSVVPYGDNFYASLNSAVFSDGSFAYIPKGVRCPIELMTYFRINQADSGQFERTLIVAEEGSYVSYLEGCTAPARKQHQLHAAVVELVALDDAEIKYSTLQKLVPRRPGWPGRRIQLRDQAGEVRRTKLQDFLDPGGDRLGHYLEVSQRHPARRQLGGRVLLGGAGEQPPAGGHRHQDDPHGQEHQEHHRGQGYFRRTGERHLPRPGQDHAIGGQLQELHPVRLPAYR